MHFLGIPAVPVVQDGQLSGALDERCLFRALAGGADWSEAIGAWTDRNAVKVSAAESGSAALRLFESEGVGYLVVVDGRGQPRGILTPSRIAAPAEFTNRPTVVGGMATPFGVYLTTGTVRGGASGWALVATGAVMFVLMGTVAIGADVVLSALPKTLQLNAWTPWVLRIFALLAFRTGMWAVGLSGIHASEHQVVNAIEQDEPLEFEAVRRMSRVHPRCGTNIAVALTLFTSLVSLAWPKELELRTLLAALVTFLLFRPLGSLAQMYLTTTPASPKQTRKGIEAARDLLRKYEQDPQERGSPLIRIYNSGLLHVILGASLLCGLMALLATVLSIPPSWRTIIGI